MKTGWEMLGQLHQQDLDEVVNVEYCFIEYWNISFWNIGNVEILMLWRQDGQVWKCWVSRITRFSQSSAWSLVPPLSIVPHLCAVLFHWTCAMQFYTEYMHCSCALNLCTNLVYWICALFFFYWNFTLNLCTVSVHWICALLILCTEFVHCFSSQDWFVRWFCALRCTVLFTCPSFIKCPSFELWTLHISTDKHWYIRIGLHWCQIWCQVSCLIHFDSISHRDVHNLHSMSSFELLQHGNSNTNR